MITGEQSGQRERIYVALLERESDIEQSGDLVHFESPRSGTQNAARAHEDAENPVEFPYCSTASVFWQPLPENEQASAGDGAKA